MNYSVYKYKIWISISVGTLDGKQKRISRNKKYRNAGNVINSNIYTDWNSRANQKQDKQRVKDYKWDDEVWLFEKVNRNRGNV